MYRSMKRVDYSDITILEASKSFLQEKKAKGLSEATIFNYGATLERFLIDMNLSSSEPISSITSATIHEWITAMANRGCKAGSINHYLADMRAFLYWCMKNSYLDSYEISLVKAQEEQIKFFTDDEIEKLLKKPKADSSFVECRTYATICFILATGARASTLCNIHTNDVDFINKDITYSHLKNKKLAIVPLSNTLEKVLKEYLKTWQRTDDTWLFCDVGEGQLTPDALRQALEKYCIKRGVSPKGPHALRHSFARGWVKNNGNAFALQKMLTHSDIAMTKRYVRLFGEDLKKDFESFSPLDTMNQAKSRTKTVYRQA